MYNPRAVNTSEAMGCAELLFLTHVAFALPSETNGQHCVGSWNIYKLICLLYSYHLAPLLTAACYEACTVAKQMLQGKLQVLSLRTASVPLCFLSFLHCSVVQEGHCIAHGPMFSSFLIIYIHIKQKLTVHLFRTSKQPKSSLNQILPS